jgi:hypothetical protein
VSAERRGDPLVEFVLARISEVRSTKEQRAYDSIAHIAIGCPGCGEHGGPPHACPGRMGRPDGGWLDTSDPYDPWASILRRLAMLWSSHEDYMPGWNTPEEMGL